MVAGFAVSFSKEAGGERAAGDTHDAAEVGPKPDEHGFELGRRTHGDETQAIRCALAGRVAVNGGLAVGEEHGVIGGHTMLALGTADEALAGERELDNEAVVFGAAAGVVEAVARRGANFLGGTVDEGKGGSGNVSQYHKLAIKDQTLFR